MTIAAFGIEDPTLSAAAVAVVVSAATAFATSVASSPLRYLVDSRLHRAKAKTDYEYEQRKQLRAEIGAYHGRLLETATSLNYRLGQIYAKRDETWLDVNGDYTKRWPRHYFFNSTIYRFMALVGIANRFEREAIYIDSRIADATNRLFVFYVKALRWTLTDTALFAGLGYGDEATDHFYTDNLRRMCASIWKDDGEGLVDLRALEDILAEEHELEPVLRFFDGLSPDDPQRLRWDRVVAFQLVLMAFIETFGYEEIHKTEDKSFDAVAARMRPEVATNLLDWMPKLGIGDPGLRHRRRNPGGRLVVAALEKRSKPGHTNRLGTQAALPAGPDPQA